MTPADAHAEEGLYAWVGGFLLVALVFLLAWWISRQPPLPKPPPLPPKYSARLRQRLQKRGKSTAPEDAADGEAASGSLAQNSTDLNDQGHSSPPKSTRKEAHHGRRS
ncbi:MAG: hypothetical protein EPO01_01845 [Aquabacterium sp.]|nr:MAG: hypothetical protein EPO12_03270 [Aquabacterium sp.]TAL26476.1 MAG: hypothetical protein EPO01_01845 [Aquabacterium sp.]